jgi:hypothetical protein
MRNYNTLLRPHVDAELVAARDARSRDDVAGVWHHLERAHVLSQPSARQHTRVHWFMIVAALWIPDLRELVGQVVRLLVAGIGSALGRYPPGNSGRARVGITQPMLIAPELRKILDEVEEARRGLAVRHAG